MTDTPALDVDAIEARANAATPGIWESCESETMQADKCYAVYQVDRDGNCIGHICECPCDEDATFIAAARTAVPDMAAEIRRLRTEITDLEAENARLSGDLSFAAPPSPSPAEVRKAALLEAAQVVCRFCQAGNFSIGDVHNIYGGLNQPPTVEWCEGRVIRALAEKEKP